MQAAPYRGQLLPFCCPTLVLLPDVAALSPVTMHVTAPGSHHPSVGTRDLMVAIEVVSGDGPVEGPVNVADDWCMSSAYPVSERKC